MKYSFSIVTADEIQSNPKAIKYLERGVAEFGGIISVAKMIQNGRSGLGTFVEIKYETKLLGAIYLTFTHQEIGKVMTNVSLAGDNFEDWAAELRQFYYKLAKDNHCDEFNLLGRRGFKKIFPELLEVATLFRVKIDKF